MTFAIVGISTAAHTSGRTSASTSCQTWKLKSGLLPSTACARACVHPAKSKPRIATRNRMAAMVPRSAPPGGCCIPERRDLKRGVHSHRGFAGPHLCHVLRSAHCRLGETVRREAAPDAARECGRTCARNRRRHRAEPSALPAGGRARRGGSVGADAAPSEAARGGGRPRCHLRRGSRRAPSLRGRLIRHRRLDARSLHGGRPTARVAGDSRVLRPNGRLLFAEHVRSENPKHARWQDRLEGIWGVVANGCHPNRRTLDAIIAAGFDVSGVEQGELPGVPALTRPYVSGRALVAGDFV